MFKRVLTNELDAYRRLAERFAVELERLPSGYLHAYKKNGHVYLRYRGNGDDRHLSLSCVEDIKLAQDLRRKRFLVKMLRTLEHDIKVLERAERDFKPIDPLAINAELNEAYHITPGEEREVVTGFTPQKAADMPLRSKSEGIIAMVLESRGYQIQYECRIIVNGKEYHPDFTILDPETCDFDYLEHLGLIDRPDYYQQNTEKLMDYWESGIRLGENLILTFETADHPLTIGSVERALDMFFASRVEQASSTSKQNKNR